MGHGFRDLWGLGKGSSSIIQIDKSSHGVICCYGSAVWFIRASNLAAYKEKSHQIFAPEIIDGLC
jgi:hypothetical protein